MEKPITIVKHEFIDSINSLIRSSGLPVIILEPIFRELYEDIKRISAKQYESDMEQYNKYLHEQYLNQQKHADS